MQTTNNIVIRHHGKPNIRRPSLEEAYKTFRSPHTTNTTPNNNSSVYIINTTEEPVWVPQKAQPQHPRTDCHVGGRSSCGESTTSATTVTATVTSGRSSVTPRKHRLHNNLEVSSSVTSSPSKNESYLNNKNISTSKLIPADDQSSTQVSFFLDLVVGCFIYSRYWFYVDYVSTSIGGCKEIVSRMDHVNKYVTDQIL